MWQRVRGAIQPASQPFSFRDITLQSIGDGAGGPGSLLLGNMLYDWNGNTGVPVSLVWDASGLFNAINAGLTGGATVSGIGVAPASDGTYVPFNDGTYLGLGSSPIATTTWNTTNAPECVYFDCLDINPSGLLPLVADTWVNQNKSDTSGATVLGLGGSLVQESGFAAKSFNLDFNQLTYTDNENPDRPDTIAPFQVGSVVPVPAAAWLFGTGLVALLGVGGLSRPCRAREAPSRLSLERSSFRHTDQTKQSGTE